MENQKVRPIGQNAAARTDQDPPIRCGRELSDVIDKKSYGGWVQRN